MVLLGDKIGTAGQIKAAPALRWQSNGDTYLVIVYITVPAWGIGRLISPELAGRGVKILHRKGLTGLLQQLKLAL